jgi:hypothetical protein
LRSQQSGLPERRPRPDRKSDLAALQLKPTALLRFAQHLVDRCPLRACELGERLLGQHDQRVPVLTGTQSGEFDEAAQNPGATRVVQGHAGVAAI